MGAVANALSSPDILHQILSLDLIAQSDLRACCLVNSDWAAAGLILLWRYPRCHSLYSFRLFLDTLRHEVDLSGPIATPISAADAAALARTAFATAPPWKHTATYTPSTSLVPTPYRPYRQPTEYGIPFHGQRIFHRAQFIRKIDFGILASVLSVHHFEILARSCKIGFRSLDLRTLRLPFSEHLLSILVNCKALRRLTLGNMRIPPEALVFLEPCFSALTELRLVDCPDSMGDSELSMILQHCSQLRELELHGDSFTDESLSWIGKICVELEVLVIDTPKMTDAVVAQIAAACTRLKSWSLIDCTALLDATVEVLEQRYGAARNTMAITRGRENWCACGSCSKRIKGTLVSLENAPGALEEVSRRANSFYSISSLSTGATFSRSSSAISSPSTSSMSSQSEPEPSSSCLASFSSSHHYFDHGPSFALDRFASTLKHITNALSGLSTIDFRNCTGIRPQLVNSLLKSQLQLEHLTLGGSSITDDALASLTETPLAQLQSLSLLNCGEISDETMVAVLFNCDQIRGLTIFGSNFTLRTFSSISLHLSQLEELHLEYVPLVMNESLQEILIKCANLRVLKLWHCRNLTQDLFTDQLVPCTRLEELDYMDKYPRLPTDHGCGTQVRFLQSLVIRFERLRILRLAKLADTWVIVNLVSYLCQLDQLERFTILQNPGLDLIDLKELKSRLPTLVHVGVGLSDSLTEDELASFAQSNLRPGIRTYNRMLDSSAELETHVN